MPRHREPHHAKTNECHFRHANLPVFVKPENYNQELEQSMVGGKRKARKMIFRNSAGFDGLAVLHSHPLEMEK
jgi:hypothetical protein